MASIMVRVGSLGRYPTIRRSVCAAFLLTSLGLLACCSSATLGSSVEGSQVDVLDKVRSLDITPRASQPVNAAAGAAAGQGRAAQAVLYEGVEVTAVSDERPQNAARGNGGFDLNFENAPVATVAKVVLGDIMGVGYTIDPRVQGTVSLVSVRPVPKSDIVFVLENALRLSGVVLALAPASVRFEALSPFGQPFLLVTVHDGKITAYNAATNEARVGAANVETAADLLSLPVEPEDLVALLSGRVAPPRDLRVAEILPPDGLGRSVKLVGRYNEQRVWTDFETGVVRRVTIVGGRTEATVTFQRGADGALTGFDLTAGNDYVTGAVRYRSLTLNAGIDAERFALTLPNDAKIHGIR